MDECERSNNRRIIIVIGHMSTVLDFEVTLCCSLLNCRLCLRSRGPYFSLAGVLVNLTGRRPHPPPNSQPAVHSQEGKQRRGRGGSGGGATGTQTWKAAAAD